MEWNSIEWNEMEKMEWNGREWKRIEKKNRME